MKSSQNLQSKRIELIAALRFLLWWGTQTFRQVLHKQAQPNIQQVSFMTRAYPDARWVRLDKDVYCLTAYTDETRVTVYKLPDMSFN